ncbi:MAG TPA: PH domain-containing protein [Pyrinomonadaceae bacterium]|nr:PH domain-containing protein [Pyrinomonadaceae bacterium]
MYCDKCGLENADDAAFCRSCGRELKEIETRVAVRPASSESPDYKAPIAAVPQEDAVHAKNADDEQIVFSIGPTLKFVYAGYVIALLGAFVIAAILGGFFQSPWLGVGLGFLILLVPVYSHFKKKLVRYTLTDTKLEIDSGFIARTRRNIPLRRVQDVTVSSSFLQRLLGFGDIVIDNASEGGERIILDDIDKPQTRADLILKEMRRLDTHSDF